MLYPLRWFLSFLSSVLRLGAGRAGPAQTAEAKTPILYEFAACPWCRIAREAISEAGLSVLVRPCPKNGKRFRPQVAEMGGRAQFPFYIDTFVPEGMYESGDVAKAMREHYAAARPILHWLGIINGVISSYAVLLAMAGGRSVQASKTQSAPLEFYGSEANPAARLVKARLSSLELEYLWHPSWSGPPRLIDPANGKTMVGGGESLRYLKTVFAL